MRYLQMISAYLLLIVVLTACQPANPATAVPEDREPQTMTPGSTSESPQTQPSNPLLTPEDMDMTSPIPLDPTAQKIVTLVKEHLAQRLGVAMEQIATGIIFSDLEILDNHLNFKRYNPRYAQTFSHSFDCYCCRDRGRHNCLL